MSFVTYEPQGAVAYLIINRPEALNALNSQVLADLDAALDAIDLGRRPLPGSCAARGRSPLSPARTSRR